MSKLLPAIYREGVPFYRCGVGAVQLVSGSNQQADLFIPENNQTELMQCFDITNQ